jgi:hypothetical protein
MKYGEDRALRGNGRVVEKAAAVGNEGLPGGIACC